MSKQRKPKIVKKKKKPSFNILNAGFKKRVKERWRKPRGTHNKKRMKFEWAGAMPKIGYRNPTAMRGIHPTGFSERLVSNLGELDGIGEVAVRIAAKVGARKRAAIIEKAGKLGLPVLNKGTEYNDKPKALWRKISQKKETEHKTKAE